MTQIIPTVAVLPPADATHDGYLTSTDHVAFMAKASAASVTTVATNLATLTTTVGTKADSSTVSALSTTVGTKADSSTVSALSTTVGTKASQSAVDSLTSTVSSHTSSISALNTLITSHDSDIDILQSDTATIASSVGSLSGSVTDLTNQVNEIHQVPGASVTGGSVLIADGFGGYAWETNNPASEIQLGTDVSSVGPSGRDKIAFDLDEGVIFYNTGGTWTTFTISGGGGSGLPDMSGQSGKFLTNNGSSASWTDTFDTYTISCTDCNATNVNCSAVSVNGGSVTLTNEGIITCTAAKMSYITDLSFVNVIDITNRKLMASDGISDVLNWSSSDGPTIKFTPGNSSVWNGNPPTIQEAIDRMADCLYALNGSSVIN